MKLYVNIAVILFFVAISGCVQQQQSPQQRIGVITPEMIRLANVCVAEQRVSFLECLARVSEIANR